MTSQNVVVGDVMSDRFVLMDGLVTVYDALQEMKRNSAVILMVNKKDSGDEFGVVVLSDIAKKVLENEDENKNITEKLYEEKVVDYLKSIMAVKEVEVSYNEFVKLANKEDKKSESAFTRFFKSGFRKKS